MSFNLHEEKIDLHLDSASINREKCRSCQDVLYIEDIDPNYGGAVSTYGPESYCKLTCLQTKKQP